MKKHHIRNILYACKLTRRYFWLGKDVLIVILWGGGGGGGGGGGAGGNTSGISQNSTVESTSIQLSILLQCFASWCKVEF